MIGHTHGTCPVGQALLSDLDDTADDAAVEQVAMHLETCPTCHSLNQAVRGVLAHTQHRIEAGLPPDLEARLLACMCTERKEDTTVTDPYRFGTHVRMPLEQAIEAVTAALKTEGFGVLTTIDMQQTLHEKLGVEIEPYVILGACNPQLAYQAMQAVHEIGLLLPCNVLVHAHDDETHIEILDPQAMFGLLRHAEVECVAHEARARLQRVIQHLEQR